MGDSLRSILIEIWVATIILVSLEDGPVVLVTVVQETPGLEVGLGDRLSRNNGSRATLATLAANELGKLERCHDGGQRYRPAALA